MSETTPEPTRRRRYSRAPAAPKMASLTPTKVQMLRYLAELRFLSLPQIAKLCCPSGRQDLSQKSARRHMRELFDAGLADVLPVSRAALAPPGAPNDASLLYGSAPNVYAPTARGLEALRQLGLIEKDMVSRNAPKYGPRNSLFLAHELEVRDVRVWLEESVRGYSHEVEHWRDSEEAAISLDRTQAPFWVRPDAWFVYRLWGEGKPVVLVGLVEVDRATERGQRRWQEKIAAYGALFSGPHLKCVTGYSNARVLVFTPDLQRRNNLTDFVRSQCMPSLAQRFWFAEHATLSYPGFEAPVWQRGDKDHPCALMSTSPSAPRHASR